MLENMVQSIRGPFERRAERLLNGAFYSCPVCSRKVPVQKVSTKAGMKRPPDIDRTACDSCQSDWRLRNARFAETYKALMADRPILFETVKEALDGALLVADSFYRTCPSVLPVPSLSSVEE